MERKWEKEQRRAETALEKETKLTEKSRVKALAAEEKAQLPSIMTNDVFSSQD